MKKRESTIIALLIFSLTVLSLPLFASFAIIMPDTGLLFVLAYITLCTNASNFLFIAVCGIIQDLFFCNQYMTTAIAYIILFLAITTLRRLVTINNKIALMSCYISLMFFVWFCHVLLLSFLNYRNFSAMHYHFLSFITTASTYAVLYWILRLRDNDEIS